MIDFEDELLEKKRNGVSNAEIRKQLLEKNYLSGDVDAIIRRIDHKHLGDLKTKHLEVAPRNNSKLIGAALLILGLILTFGTYLGFIRLGNFWLFAYGPILGGLAMMASSRRRSFFKSAFRK